MAVNAYIESHKARWLAELQDYCRIASISTQDLNMAEGAAFTARMLEQRGLKTRILPTPRHPVVYGELKGKSDRALLLYSHYDCQPPDPVDEWVSPPFAANVVEGRLIARGVADHKSSTTARIQALEAYLATHGTPPFTIKFLVEGEEELGSAHLGQVMEAHRDLLRCEAALYSGGQKDELDNPVIHCGSKGMCYVELRCQTMAEDMHSSRAALVENPAWRLAWALNTLKGPDGRVQIEGFYDAVRPPSEADRAALQSIPSSLGLEKLRALMFDPTCTICGWYGGYMGPGSKTVSPARAAVKIDMRLVADQDPDDIAAKLRRHLDSHGFADIEVVRLGSLVAERTPVDQRLVQVIQAAALPAYGRPAAVYPAGVGSGPRYLFKRILGVPIVADCGVMWHGSNMHAPNESVRLEDYWQGVAHMAYIFERF